MSDYTEHTVAPIHVGGIVYRTRSPIIWAVGFKESNWRVIVPASFEFDVSVPFWLRCLFNPHEPRYFKAAALHDWLLKKGWDRMVTGAVFHDALRADGVSKWRALAMWLAVSLWRYR